MTVRALAQSKAQLTLDFEPGLVERYPSAMDRLRAAVYGGAKPLKTIAADMDIGAARGPRVEMRLEGSAITVAANKWRRCDLLAALNGMPKD